MKTKALQRKIKSFSCKNLQREIFKSYQQPTPHNDRKKNFIPFCSQRDLGKLILKQKLNTSRVPKNDELLQKITFKNFHKIYKLVSTYENKKYSELTRKPQQPNLINHEWKVNTLSKLNTKSTLITGRSSLKSISIQPNRSVLMTTKSNNNSVFEKANEFLFKKINKVKNPEFKPELQDMYTNYVKICELNQNIRREDLVADYKRKLNK